MYEEFKSSDFMALMCVVINPRHACAARVTVVVVCVSIHYPDIMNRSTNFTTYSVSGIGRIICSVFSETAVFESYDVKHKRKWKYANYNWLTSTAFCLFAYRRASGSYNG